jgi:hypothetical protein
VVSDSQRPALTERDDIALTREPAPRETTNLYDDKAREHSAELRPSVRPVFSLA